MRRTGEVVDGSDVTDVPSATVVVRKECHRRLSFLRLWCAMLVAWLASLVLMIDPSGKDGAQSVDALLDPLFSKGGSSAGVSASWAALFVVLTASAYWALGQMRRAKAKQWAAGAICAALLAWTLTIPPHDGIIDDEVRVVERPLWSARFLRFFYLGKWAVLTAALLLLVVAVCVTLSRSAMPSDTETTAKGKVLGWLRFRPTRVLALGGAIFLCWIPVLVLCGPVRIFSDTSAQLLMYRNPQANAWMDLFRRRPFWLDDQHPFADTLLYGWVDDIGRAIGHELVPFVVLAWIQAIACAMALAALFCWINDRTTIPRPWLVLMLFVFAVCPTFSLTMVTVVKDTTWMPLFLAWLVCFCEYSYRLLNQRRITAGLLVSIIVFSILAGFAKKISPYITCAATLVLLFLPHARRRRWETALAAVVAPLLVVVVVPAAVYPALRIDRGKTSEAIAVPIQQVTKAFIDHGKDISAADRRTVERALDLRAAEKGFSSSSSNSPTKMAFRDRKISKDAELRFLLVWAKLGLRYPQSYSTAVPYLWNAFVPGPQTVIGVGPTCQGWASGPTSIHFPNLAIDVNSRYQDRYGSKLLKVWEAVPPFALLDQACMYTVWIPLFGLMACLMRRRYRQLAILAPVAVTFASIFVLQTIWIRLLLGMVCVFPVALAAAWVPSSVPSQKAPAKGRRRVRSVAGQHLA